MLDTEQNTPAMGDNNPPSDLEIQESALKADHKDLLKRKVELMAGAKNMPKDIDVDDEKMAGRVTDQVKLMKKCAVEADKKRETQKAPYLAAGKLIQKFFKDDIETPLRNEATKVEKVLTAWNKKVADRDAKIAKEKAEEEERIRKEEAEAARIEAERLADAAKDEADLEAAMEAEEAAEVADLLAGDAEIVTEKTAQLQPNIKSNAKVATTYGAKMSNRKRVVHEIKYLRIVDLEALRPYLSEDAINMAARAHIKAHGNDLAQIPHVKGIRFFEEEKTNVI